MWNKDCLAIVHRQKIRMGIPLSPSTAAMYNPSEYLLRRLPTLGMVEGKKNALISQRKNLSLKMVFSRT